ncbi:MAG: hypothetical protein EBS86_16270, partial [Crocinitomicaceae bacterium]|nr:hypothetical protein [Crocinitomicaceae bacterium]
MFFAALRNFFKVNFERNFVGLALVLAIVGYTNFSLGQCGPYQVYESFGTGSIPTQGGTWAATSMTYGNTSAARSGQYGIVFDAAGDIIQTPLISNPGIFSFWYRRTSTSTGTPQFTIETSPDGSTWTARGTIASFTTTFQQFSLDIGALSLTNIYIRIKDTRASGAASRYLDDLSWTSTVATENTVLIQGSSCSPSIVCGVNYKVYDIGGINDQYNSGMASAPMIISPASSGGIVTASFSSLGTETTTDYVFLYNGNSTSSPQFSGSGFSGSTTPSGSFVSTHSTGAITINFTSDVSIVGSGFVANISCSVPVTCSG